MAIKTYQKGSTLKLSANFNVSEFACHGSGCCTTVLIDEQLVKYLQQIRDHFGAAVTITSGYRCPIHNKNIGSSTGSRHAKGQACDIAVSGVAPAEVAKYAESIGILGIGLYETKKDGFFVHVDTRTTKAFWYGQAQASRKTFGGSSATTTTKPTTPTILRLILHKAKAFIVAMTTAAPVISPFMSPIPEDGFIEIPPESKVTPLPTNPKSH